MTLKFSRRERIAVLGLTEIYKDLRTLQGLENWSSQKNVLKDLKSMNLEVNFVCKPVNEIFVTDGISKIKFMFKRCLFYLVKRGTANGSIDQGLKQQAEELGVKIHFNSRMKEEDVDIVATGPKKAFAVAKGFVFETDMDDTSIALIGDNVAFKGYSYLLVSNGYGTICSVVFGDLKRVVKCFEETKKVFSNLFNLKMKSQKPVSGYGYFNYPPCLVKSNRLFVGEAAGLQDALFGFGMRYAITSGYLAAESIINSVDYKTLVEKTLYNKLKASIVNRFLWERLGDKRFELVESLKENKNLPNLFFRLYNFSFRKQRVLFPFALQILKLKYRT